MPTPSFDLVAAHRWFAADCFNRVWDLMEKADRTDDETERMISLSHSSVSHWREREDCTRQNLSIGYWQLARVYALAEQPDNARHYGRLCLEHSAGEPPFYLGYAHESLARAEQLAGNEVAFVRHLAEARRYAAQVVEAEDRAVLEKDLDGLDGRR